MLGRIGSAEDRIQRDVQERERSLVADRLDVLDELKRRIRACLPADPRDLADISDQMLRLNTETVGQRRPGSARAPSRRPRLVGAAYLLAMLMQDKVIRTPGGTAARAWSSRWWPVLIGRAASIWDRGRTSGVQSSGADVVVGAGQLSARRGAAGW